jgi:muramidase (phage lysozyme)
MGTIGPEVFADAQKAYRLQAQGEVDKLNLMINTVKPIMEAEGSDVSSTVGALFQRFPKTTTTESTMADDVLGALPPDPGAIPDAKGGTGEPPPDPNLFWDQNLPFQPQFVAPDNGQGNTSGDQSTNELSPIRDVIGSAEAPEGYNQVYGNKDLGIVPTASTVADVRTAQDTLVSDGSKSSAVGRYQIIRKTMDDLISKGVISPTDTFDEATQDKAANYLIQEAGYRQFKAGDISREEFSDNLAKVWAGLPLADGQSYYQGVAGNKATVNRSQVLAALDAVKPPSNIAAVSIGQVNGKPAGATAGVYANIPAKEVRDFQRWNPDPVGNTPKELASVQPQLASVFTRAQALAKADGIDLVVASGNRDEAKQQEAIALGWSQTKESNHIGGNAMDVWALKDGAVTFDQGIQDKVSKYMKAAAQELGVSVGWGGDWRGFKDRPHFELTGASRESPTVASVKYGKVAIGDLTPEQLVHISSPSAFASLPLDKQLDVMERMYGPASH